MNKEALNSFENSIKNIEIDQLKKIKKALTERAKATGIDKELKKSLNARKKLLNKELKARK